jgi:hypothetical protein
VSRAGKFRRRWSGYGSLFARTFSAMWANLRGNEGAEILEFAISLPLLIVVAVGVFDFGSAFTVKQKVGNIALQGARVASNQPTTDLSLNAACGAPASICSGGQQAERLRAGNRTGRGEWLAKLDVHCQHGLRRDPDAQN